MLPVHNGATTPPTMLRESASRLLLIEIANGVHLGWRADIERHIDDRRNPKCRIRALTRAAGRKDASHAAGFEADDVRGRRFSMKIHREKLNRAGHADADEDAIEAPILLLDEIDGAGDQEPFDEREAEQRI